MTGCEPQVMVAGSEPTAEWRVQYYVPNYLLTGAPRPVITSAPAQAAYTKYFTVTFSLASGSVSQCAHSGSTR